MYSEVYNINIKLKYEHVGGINGIKGWTVGSINHQGSVSRGIYRRL